MNGEYLPPKLPPELFATPEDRGAYYLELAGKIADREPFWFQRNPESELCKVYDFYSGGELVGYINKNENGNCYVYQLTDDTEEDGLKVKALNTNPLKLDEAKGILEATLAPDEEQ